LMATRGVPDHRCGERRGGRSVLRREGKIGIF
jgi:hypothetical protein